MTREQLHETTLATTVSSDAPTITFLTHGHMGKAGNWSNSLEYDSKSNYTGSEAFTYDSSSLIEKLRNNIPDGIKLYRAKSGIPTSNPYVLMLIKFTYMMSIVTPI